uniref:Leucine rich repeat containing 75A n=1 Tax=Capra hircus TaxID=9925 RepID=A0A8C2P8K4_CAPHI
DGATVSRLGGVQTDSEDGDVALGVGVSGKGQLTSSHTCPGGASLISGHRPLLQDLGMESTSLDDVLYRYASFRNLVDPITHDLIISLARYIHCPKPVGQPWSEPKLCRQLTYHLTSREKPAALARTLLSHLPFSLKAVLAGSPPDNTVDLSGIPLTSRDLERVASYLQRCGEQVDSVELGFTGLTDDMVLQLLPALSTLPRMTTLALNGNRLTRALLRDLTDALRDPRKFPSVTVTWIDLGNNVDIFSLPQPFLLSLRKRSPKQGHLPTILELGEGPGSGVGQGHSSWDRMAGAPGKLHSGPGQRLPPPPWEAGWNHLGKEHC